MAGGSSDQSNGAERRRSLHAHPPRDPRRFAATLRRGSLPDMSAATAIPIEEIRAARERIAGQVVRTPLVRLALDGAPGEIWLKLETLQPIGSFKLRGASSALALAAPEALARGVWTASAGNMAQGVAWQARRLGLPCTVVAPDHAPPTKLAAIDRLGARVLKVPFADWFQILSTRTWPGVEGFFVHPVSDAAVMAGKRHH